MRIADLTTLIRGTARTRQSVWASLRLVTPAWICVGCALALSLIGVVAIDLASAATPHAGLTPLAARQGVFVLVGVGSALVIALPHWRYVGLVAVPVFVVMVGLLVFLLVPAVPAWLVTPRNGTRGWINLRVVDFQPAEVAKIAYVLVIARYLRYRQEHRRFLGLVPLGLLTAIPVGLITLQPDLGTASLFIPSLFAMLLAAGARVRHLVLIVAIALAAAPAVYPLLRPHQKARIVGLIRQMQGDRSSAHDLNFQSYTAQTLTGAGGLTGQNEANARALVRYNRLPEAHNDMIFAVVVDRWGLVGGAGVMGLSLLWMVGAVLTAGACREPFGRLVVVGLTAFIAAQVVINIGMTLGLVPIIGVTLPFVSYGGSSMLASWLMTGLVLGIGVHRAIGPYRPSFEFDEDESL